MILGTQWRGPWSISVHIILFLIGSASIHGRRVDPAANFEQFLNLIAIKLLLPCLNLFRLNIILCWNIYVTQLSHASSRHQGVQIRGSASRGGIFYQFLLMNTWSSGSQAIKVDANQTRTRIWKIWVLDLHFRELWSWYRYDSEKQEGCGVVAHERLTEPRVTMEWLLAKPRSFWNLPAFSDLNGSFYNCRLIKWHFW